MTTEKLYYQDQYLGHFTANILKSRADENGRKYVVLDKTAFYPTGGGQPHDTGTLNGVKVYDVEEIDGEIRHYIEQPIFENQNECIGKIDWERRFDHMQQHAGQHILSAAFGNEYRYKTVSFHLGNEICSIDLDIADLAEAEALEVERIANTVILENHPIETKWVTKEELANYSLRKELSVTENIRLVIIPDFDNNGCGGTHPKSTGQVSSIKILQWEKQKKHVRVFFVCGNRVLRQLHDKHQVIQVLTALLSAPQERMEEVTSRALQQTKNSEKTIAELKTQLMDYEANHFVDQSNNDNNISMIKAVYQNRPISELQQLAKLIAMKSNDALVFFVNETENKLQLVCARGNDLTINMNQLVKQVLPIINGKGGGSDSIAQGGGEKLISTERLMEEMISKVFMGNY